MLGFGCLGEMPLCSIEFESSTHPVVRIIVAFDVAVQLLESIKPEVANLCSSDIELLIQYLSEAQIQKSFLTELETVGYLTIESELRSLVNIEQIFYKLKTSKLNVVKSSLPATVVVNSTQKLAELKKKDVSEKVI